MRRLPFVCFAMVVLAGCADDEPPPQAVLTAFEPGAICTGQASGPTLMTITGEHLDQSLVVEWVSSDGGGIVQHLPVADETGTSMVVGFDRGEGSPAALEPPNHFTLRVTDDHERTTELADDLIYYSTFSLSGVGPSTGSGTVAITLDGGGFFDDDLAVTLDATPPVVAASVEAVSTTSMTAELDLAGVAAGTYSMTVVNPGGCTETLADAFTVE